MQGKETIFHVEKEGKHFYFGSITAICESMVLGIQKQSLWNYKIRQNKPYYGKGFTIRKGIIIRSKNRIKL